jgi:hypothetical protein
MCYIKRTASFIRRRHLRSKVVRAKNISSPGPHNQHLCTFILIQGAAAPCTPAMVLYFSLFRGLPPPAPRYALLFLSKIFHSLAHVEYNLHRNFFASNIFVSNIFLSNLLSPKKTRGSVEKPRVKKIPDREDPLSRGFRRRWLEWHP